MIPFWMDLRVDMTKIWQSITSMKNGVTILQVLRKNGEENDYNKCDIGIKVNYPDNDQSKDIKRGQWGFKVSVGIVALEAIKSRNARS